MSATLKALVLCGEGINCETETAFALSRVGFHAEVKSINELVAENFSQDSLLKKYSLLALPGGFSYGDELGSGRVLGIKIKRALKLDLQSFAINGGLVLGVCNGFQALIRLGTFGTQVSITRNSTNQFIDRWANLKKSSANSSPWLKGIEQIDLPIRHGEGRIVFANNVGSSNQSFEPAISYTEDVNGSADRLAGLTTAQGRILGLMPHPEAFIRWTQYPTWTSSPARASSDGDGIRFFKNAFDELKKGN